MRIKNQASLSEEIKDDDGEVSEYQNAHWSDSYRSHEPPTRNVKIKHSPGPEPQIFKIDTLQYSISQEQDVEF